MPPHVITRLFGPEFREQQGSFPREDLLRMVTQATDLGRIASQGEVSPENEAITQIDGPYEPVFEKVREGAQASLTAINPALTLEQIKPINLRSPEARRIMDSLSADPSEEILDRAAMVRSETLLALDALARNKLGPEMEGQCIPRGQLAVPPYHWNTDRSTAACFCMIFNGITTGRRLDSSMVAQEFSKHTHYPSNPELEYLKACTTEAFYEFTGRKVQVTQIRGADLDLINTKITEAKNEEPDALVYCMVKLKSSNVAGSCESNILLSVPTSNDKKDATVVVLDPTGYNKTGNPRKLSRKAFVRNWAAGDNMAYLIVARSPYSNPRKNARKPGVPRVIQLIRRCTTARESPKPGIY